MYHTSQAKFEGKSRAGWFALALAVVALGLATPANSAERVYWISADEILWDYTPSYPINLMTGEEFTDEQGVFVDQSRDRIGHVYRKAVYRAYSANFAALIDGATDSADGVDTRSGTDREHLGLLGPIIRGEVGDAITIHFRNNTGFPVSMHPHGVFYTKSSEGAPYADGTDGADKADDAVPPGGTHTYRWPVPLRAGPAVGDPSSIVWPYHSHTDEPADTNAGLIGAIVIYRAGGLTSNPSLDREFVSVFTVFDENASLYIDDNIADLAGRVDPEDDGFVESNLMHSINGRLYGNNTGYVMRTGERVRWYIMAFGTEVDLHTPHWHGATLVHNGHRIDVTEVLPASSKTMDLTADNPGIWMFHCHVNDHIVAGMMTRFMIAE